MRASTLLFCLAIGTLASCGKDAPTPAAAAGSDPAGVVERVEGTVTARRAAAKGERTLATQSMMFADDTVKTAAASSVAIRLAHNNALWTLESEQSRRVDQSAAWGAPKQAAVLVVADKLEAPQTASAGRHSDQEAAQTGESAARPEAEAAKEAKHDADTPPQMAPPPAAPPVRAAAPKRHTAAKAAAARAARPSALRGGGSDDPMDDLGGGGLGILGPKREGSASGGWLKSVDFDNAPASKGGSAGSVTVAAKAPSATVSAAAESGTPSAAMSVLSRRSAGVKKCYENALAEMPNLQGKLEVRIVVDASGVVTRVDVVESTLDHAAALKCAVEKIRATKFAAGEALDFSYVMHFSTAR
jgi:outer membrane biosynthesis protein TonB